MMRDGIFMQHDWQPTFTPQRGPTRESIARAIFFSDYRNADLVEQWPAAWQACLRREQTGESDGSRIEAAARAADAVMALYEEHR
jgi:hypothetical protein